MSVRSLLEQAAIRVGRAAETESALEALGLIELAVADLNAARERLRVEAIVALARKRGEEAAAD